MNTTVLDRYEALCAAARAEAELVAQVAELVAYEVARGAEEAPPPTLRSAPHAEPASRPVLVDVA